MGNEITVMDTVEDSTNTHHWVPRLVHQTRFCLFQIVSMHLNLENDVRSSGHTGVNIILTKRQSADSE